MKLNIRQKLLVALATLLIATAAAQQLYNRYALIAAAPMRKSIALKPQSLRCKSTA